MSKSETTDGGQISVLVGHAANTYTVTAKTKFETVRGTQRSGSSFLADYAGQQVSVSVIPGSNPPTASLVQVMLPAPPPVHIVTGPPKPGHVHGTVLHIGNGKLTIYPHHHVPPPPVLGTISDVTKDANTPTASITLQVNGKPRKFVVNEATGFQQVRGDIHKPGSFLKEHKGETALIFPRMGHPHVAALVEILLPGGTTHAHSKPHHHHLTFIVTGATKFSRVRDGHSTPTTVAAVVPGEEVSVLATGIHSHLAATVAVILPHAIHGEVVSATATALTLKGHHHGNPAKSAQGTVTIPLVAATHFSLLEGKTKSPATLTALKPGAHAIVFPAALPPHPAEAVEIHPHHAHQTTTAANTTHPSGKTAITAQGVISSVRGETLFLKVSHPTSATKPGQEAPQAFRLEGAKITNHEHKPITSAALRPGETVTVHAHSGNPPVAHTVLLHDKTTPTSATPAQQHHLTAEQQKHLQEHQQQLLNHQAQQKLHQEQQEKLQAQISQLKQKKKLSAEEQKQLQAHQNQLLHHQEQQKKQLAEHHQKMLAQQQLVEKQLADQQKKIHEYQQQLAKQQQAHQKALIEAQQKLLHQQQEQMKRYLEELKKQGQRKK